MLSEFVKTALLLIIGEKDHLKNFLVLLACVLLFFFFMAQCWTMPAVAAFLGIVLILAGRIGDTL